MSFIERKNFATEIIKKVRHPTDLAVSNELLEMILQGAEQYEKMIKSVSGDVSEIELVLMSISAMSRNASTLDRLESIGVETKDAKALLEEVRSIARSLAEDKGLTVILERLFDRQ